MSPQVPPPTGQKASEFVSLRYVKYAVSTSPMPPSAAHHLYVEVLAGEEEEEDGDDVVSASDSAS